MNDEITHYVGYISDCTSEVEALKNLEIQYKNREKTTQMWIDAVEKNGDGLWEWDIQTNEVYFSPQWKKMLGFEENEISSNLSEWKKRVHPDDLEKVISDIENYISGKTLYYSSEHRVLCKDGSYKWILDKGSITTCTIDGKAKTMVGIHSDITTKKQLIIEKINYQKRFEDMFQNHDIIMFLVDPNNGKIIDANKQAVKFYGYSYDELVNMTVMDINQLSLSKIKEILKLVKSKKLNNFEFHHKLKNGEIRVVNVNSSPIEIYNDTILFSIVKDITKEKRIEELYQKTIAYNRTLIDNLPILIWLKDENGNFLAVNQAFSNATTINNPELIVGKNDFDVWPKELAESYVKDDKEVLKSAKSKLVEEKILDGNEIKWFETFKSPVFSSDKKLLGTIGYAIDITDKLKTQELLKKQNSQLELEKTKLSSIIHAIPDLLWIKDKQGKYLLCNDRFEELYGEKKEQIIGKTDYDFIDKNLANFFKMQDTKASQSDKPISNYETLPFKSDGHIEQVHITKTKVLTNDGELYGILGLARDISELKEYEAKLKKQKNEFETIFNYAHDGIAIIDLESKFLNCNDAFLKLTRYSKEELLTKTCKELTKKEDREKNEEALKTAIEHGFIDNVEKRCIIKDGSIVFVIMSAISFVSKGISPPIFMM